MAAQLTVTERGYTVGTRPGLARSTVAMADLTPEPVWRSSLSQALRVGFYYLVGVLLFLAPLVIFLLLMMGMHEMH